ncbi:PAP2 family protein [Butyrivibrio proteoclasticus B316]|uniref:PAP2 family protein n=1 Tax=Butyrivibrio proteoclasticus (strain ATCC 51982 / DSM 14932 / B316) TaxID=515622 RepID=E0RVB5_BUTPB|nr:phosphatase PAP2 family protein [Butyrivibrio proteoclasticus]ADL34534.1 PAP2 family protein [Butyrivibrio proteoclasticus B316]
MKKFYEDWTGRKLCKETRNDLLKLAVPILIYAPIYLSWFIYIEKHKFSHYAVIHTVVDDYIPFVEAFIIPYFMWFAYVSLTLLFFMFSFDVEDYYKNFFFLATGMTIFLVISTLFPNMHNLRPAVMPRDNIFTHLVQFIYSSDTSTNLWPSIHVYNSIGTMIAVHHSKRFNKAGVVIMDVIGWLIILSTLFVKQHSFYDVTTAFIMAIIFYIVFYHTSLLENFCIRQEEKVAVRYN